MVLSGVLEDQILPRAESSRDIERLLLRVCSTETETFPELKRLFESVQDTGEPGKKVLLKIANSRRPERARALRYLIRLEDRRAVAVAHRALRDAHSEPSFREAVLEGVATFRDAAMINEAFEAFKSTSVLLRLGVPPLVFAFGLARCVVNMRNSTCPAHFRNFLSHTYLMDRPYWIAIDGFRQITAFTNPRSPAQ